MFASQKQYLFETPSNIVYERRLDTALRRSQLENFYERIKAGTTTEDDNLIVGSPYLRDGIPDEITTLGYTDILSSILGDTREGKQYENSNAIKNGKIRHDAVMRAVQIQLDCLLEKSDLPSKNAVLHDFHAQFKKTPDSLLVRNILEVLRTLNTAVERSHAIHSPHVMRLPIQDRHAARLKLNYYEDPNSLFTVVWSQHLIYLETQHRRCIMPRPYLLLIHNKLADLASVLMLAQYNAGAALPHDAVRITAKFLDELIALHYEYDEQFYKITKSLEPLCIAESILELDDWDNHEFLDTLASDLRVDPGFRYRTSNLRKILKRVNSVMRHELCCLSKLLGHPLVLMREGSISLNKKTNEQYEIDPMKIVECTNYIKENYIRNHILRHGKWPPCHITSKNCHTGLEQAWIKNVDPMSREIVRDYGIAPVSQYVFVDLLPSLKFNKLENAIRYLKDKTITLLRSDVISQYLELNREPVRSTWVETRLLLYYMMHEQATTDHVKFLDSYAKSKDLEELMDYLVCRIVPKEKEHKDIFRGFGCQTYFARIQCLAQEKNAMHYLDLYSDEQAMTLSELELVRKLYAFRTITRAYKGHTALYINVDASSWNNHFRAETVDSVMKETLSKVFGNESFSKTHLKYEKTLFYTPDEAETAWWEGQAGGIEGLNQDTWVVTYLGQIKTAMADFNLKYHAFCKGDDFRIIILVPPTTLDIMELSELKTRVVTKVSDVADQFGHKIKVQDSYGSVAYFCFSKASSYGTIEFPQMFRKIQKCYGATNAFIPTLDEYVGTAYSNAHSACRVSPNTIPCYVVALKWSVWYILQHYVYAQLSTDQVTALLLTPSMVGGFPIIYLHNMFVRAESDLLSPFLHLLVFCKQRYISIYRYMSNFARVPKSPPKSIVALCKDPYAIPCDRPDLPSTVLRKSLLEHLKPMIKNEELILLFRAYEGQFTAKMLEVLQSANVYNPKIFSLIYSALPAGLVEELTRKFESSRSVHEVLILRAGRRSADRILCRIIAAEEKIQNWRCARLLGKNTKLTKPFTHLLTTCPAESASIVRQQSWGKPIEGVTTPPLAHLIKMTTPILTTNPLWDAGNAFLLEYTPPSRYIPRCTGNENWGSSDLEPFLGHNTSSGMLHPTVHIVEKDPILSKIRTLIELVSWTSTEDIDRDGVRMTSNLYLLLEQVIKLYTGHELGDLVNFGGTHKHGTVDHHLGSPQFRSSIVPNTLSNVYQCFSGDSKKHARIAAEPGHYLINYLYIYCHSICMASIELNFKASATIPTTMWVVTDDCEFCNAPIRETPIVCDVSKIPATKSLKLLSTKAAKNAVKILQDAVEEYNQTEFRDMQAVDNISLEIATQGLMQEMVDVVNKERKKLETRYTGHNVTREGQATLTALQPRNFNTGVDSHEFSKLPAIYIASALHAIIFDEAIRMFPSATVATIGDLMTIIPAEQIPWYPIIHMLYVCGRLRAIVSHLQMKFGNLSGASAVNVVEATYYIGVTCFRQAAEWTTPVASVFLTYYSSERYAPHFRRSLRMRVQTWINHKYGTDLFEANRVYSSEAPISPILEAKVKEVLENLHIIYSIDYLEDDYINALLQRLDIDHNIEISVLSVGEVDQDSLPNLEEVRTDNGYEALKHRFSSLPWGDVEEEIEEQFEEAYERVSGLASECRLTLIVTTLQQCVYTINERSEEQEEREREYDREFTHEMLRNQFPTPRITHVARRMLSVPCERLRDELALPRIERQNFSDDKVILDQSMLHRPYGEATIGLTRMAELWSTMRLPKIVNTSASCIVFGDGLGGTSTFCCSVAPGSYIKILSLPERGQSEYVPPLTEMYADRYGCRIDDGAIRRGHYDASLVTTFHHLEQDARIYHLIISDIEYRDAETTDSYRITTNIARFFLRNRSINSILVMQMRLDEPNVIYDVCRILSGYVTDLYLIKLKASTRHEQIYLVAWGLADNYMGDYTQTRLFDSLRLHDVISRYVSRLHQTYEMAKDHMKILIKPWSADWGDLRYWLDILPNRVQHVMWRYYKIDYRLSEYKDKVQGIVRAEDAILACYPNAMDGQLNRSESYLDAFRHPEVRALNVNLNTRKHVTKMYEKYLTIRGFVDTYRKFVVSPGLSIKEETLRRGYSQVIAVAPPRLRIPPISGKHFRRYMMHEDYKLSLYPKYHKGCTAAIELVAWVHNARNWA